MNDLETRVHEGLHTETGGPSARDMLLGVRRVARRRRARRTTGFLAAAALVVATTVTGGGVALHRRDLPSAHRPGAETAAMTQISVTASGQVFQVVAQGGCEVRCSIVRTRVPGGGWTDLHTFRSPDAPAFPGPLWKIAMAPNGRDGWVWGQHVYSTHDGGSTWSQVSGFPASDGAAYNDEIIVGGDEAWAQVDLTGGARMLLRTPVGSDSWTRSSTPTTSFYAINALPDGRVVLELDNDRWSIKDQHLLVGDGTTWQHEKLRFYRVPSLFHGALFTQSYPFLAANSGSLGASGYDRRGNHSSIPVGTTGTTASRPVGFVEQLFVRGDQAAVVNPDGVTPVHLRLGEDDRIADSALLGNRVVLVTYGGRFFSSTDNGRHWREIT